MDVGGGSAQQKVKQVALVCSGETEGKKRYLGIHRLYLGLGVGLGLGLGRSVVEIVYVGRCLECLIWERPRAGFGLD